MGNVLGEQMNMFPVLKTERLILREITEEDVEGIFACFSNNRVTRYYGLEKLESLEQARQLVSSFTNNYSVKRGIRWGIERKGTKGIIGTIGFNNWAPIHKRAEIGFELHPNYWRKGYVSEAACKILSYGFREMGLTRIAAVVFTENEASNNLLLKIGFQKEGLLRNYMYQNGDSHDTYMYSIINKKG